MAAPERVAAILLEAVTTLRAYRRVLFTFVVLVGAVTLALWWSGLLVPLWDEEADIKPSTRPMPSA